MGLCFFWNDQYVIKLMRGCLCWQWSGEVSGGNPEGDVCQSPTCDSSGAGGEKLAAEETGRDSYRAEKWDRLRLISVLYIQTLEPQLCLVTEESQRCSFTVFLSHSDQFPGLQSKMRVVLRVEVEAVKFLKEEPHRLDALLKRCKSITDTLTTLRR